MLAWAEFYKTALGAHRAALAELHVHASRVALYRLRAVRYCEPRGEEGRVVAFWRALQNARAVDMGCLASDAAVSRSVVSTLCSMTAEGQREDLSTGFEALRKRAEGGAPGSVPAPPDERQSPLLIKFFHRMRQTFGREQAMWLQSAKLGGATILVCTDALTRLR